MRAARLAVGARPGDSLLADLDGSALRGRALADAVNAVQRETGRRLTAATVAHAPTTLARWANTRRITTTPLGR